MIELELHGGIAVVSVDNPAVTVITTAVREALNQAPDRIEARCLGRRRRCIYTGRISHVEAQSP